MVIAPKPNRALDLRLTYVPILDNLTTGTDTLQLPHPLWLAVADLRHGAGACAWIPTRSAVAWQQAARQTVSAGGSGRTRARFRTLNLSQERFE